MAIIEAVRWELLDKQTETIVDEIRVERGSGEIYESIYTDVRATGSFRTFETGRQWWKYRVRPVVTIDGTEYAQGVFIPTMPETSTDLRGQAATIRLHDKSQTVRRDTYGRTFAFDAGTRVTDAVRQVLDSVGITRVAMTPAADKLTAPMVWEPDVSKMRIINDLLKAINYYGLFFDWQGVAQVQPYVLPARRPVVATLDGPHGVKHLPEWGCQENTVDTPNFVIVIGQLEGAAHDAPPIIGRARHDDPDSPLSTAAVGVITHTERTDVTSQANADAIAARVLSEKLTASAVWTVQSQFVAHPLHSGLVWANSRTGIAPRMVTITERRVKLASPLQQQMKLREVTA